MSHRPSVQPSIVVHFAATAIQLTQRELESLGLLVCKLFNAKLLRQEVLHEGERSLVLVVHTTIGVFVVKSRQANVTWVFSARSGFCSTNLPKAVKQIAKRLDAKKWKICAASRLGRPKVSSSEQGRGRRPCSQHTFVLYRFHGATAAPNLPGVDPLGFSGEVVCMATGQLPTEPPVVWQEGSSEFAVFSTTGGEFLLEWDGEGLVNFWLPAAALTIGTLDAARVLSVLWMTDMPRVFVVRRDCRCGQK